jgi:hypothetical protein
MKRANTLKKLKMSTLTIFVALLLMKQGFTQRNREPVYLITMVTPSNAVHTSGSEIGVNEQNLLLTPKGRQNLYSKGLALKEKYSLLKDLNSKEIYAESSDLNYTI